MLFILEVNTLLFACDTLVPRVKNPRPNLKHLFDYTIHSSSIPRLKKSLETKFTCSNEDRNKKLVPNKNKGDE